MNSHQTGYFHVHSGKEIASGEGESDLHL